MRDTSSFPPTIAAMVGGPTISGRSRFDAIRVMGWFDAERARGYSIVLILSLLPLLVYGHTVLIAAGLDFEAFWAAGRLFWTDPAASYDPDALAAVQAHVPSGKSLPFANPPPFLLLLGPFGLLPYRAALILFAAATLLFYLAASRWLRAFWPSIAFAPTIVCVVIGQNGLLTGGLFLAGARWLERRPWLSGALLGALVIKPQLGVLIPVALICGRAWRAIAGAVASVGLLIVASWWVFGTATIMAFLDALAFQSTIFSDPAIRRKMQTVFAQSVHLGATPMFAAGLQLASAVVAALIVAMVWTRSRCSEARFAVLAACTPFATPYLYGYDLAFLLLPIVWLARNDRPLAWERAVIGAAFVSPILSAPAAVWLGFNPGLIVNALLLACTLRRFRLGCPVSGPGERLTEC